MMNMSRGVLTIAHTNVRYVREAVALARSIRLRDPHLPLAVATNFDPAVFENAFDIVIPWNFSGIGGVTAKIKAYEISPFDVTILLDTDCLAAASVEAVFECFAGRDFAVFGGNSANPWYFGSVDVVRAAAPAETYPVFNGGLYYFIKSAAAAAVFRYAKETLRDYERLQILPTKKGPSDESLFSVAMARVGLRATPRDPARILFAPLGFGSRLRIDVMAGRCELLNGDHGVPAVIVHFVFPWVLRYEYVREVMRLEAAFGKRAGLLRNDLLVRIAARATSFWLYRVPRIRRRIRRWKRRLSEMA
ncbi:MAG: hypothetical protein NTZ50_04880 [Chloroflexi bacterium]|nr:hypothetical protein [Chloroflexota bacterium]